MKDSPGYIDIILKFIACSVQAHTFIFISFFFLNLFTWDAKFLT